MQNPEQSVETMKNTLKDLAILATAVIGSTLLIWAPFILRIKSFWGLEYPQTGLETIWRNFDGLNYIAVAKSLYNPQILQDQFSSLGLSPIYFASHFPVYPVLISSFAPLFGFLNSMLFVTVLFTVLSTWMFYLLVRDFKLTSDPLWLSLVFLALPARWVVVRSVGAPEPVFIFLLLATFYFLRKNWYLLSGLATAAAVLVRSPGTILWLAATLSTFGPWLASLVKRPTRFHQGYGGQVQFPWRGLAFVAGPIAALGLFWFYKVAYGDFLAYFHSGDNIHLTLPPWPVFNSAQFWVGTFWLENIIYVYILMAAATIILWKKKLYDLAIFVGIYFLAASLVAHLDIGRYTIPAAPLVLIAFEKWINTREFKIVLAILLIPIYLFTQNFLLGNISPVVDFTPFR